MTFSGPDRLRLRVETSSRLDRRMVPVDLPLLVARNHGGAHQPGMEHGYHLYPDGTRMPEPGCSDGLVQPVHAELVAVVDDGWRYLTIETWNHACRESRCVPAWRGRSIAN